MTDAHNASVQTHLSVGADPRYKQQAPPERGLSWRGIGYCLRRRDKPSSARPRPSSESVASLGTGGTFSITCADAVS
jgi:hypothetical protein